MEQYRKPIFILHMFELKPFFRVETVPRGPLASLSGATYNTLMMGKYFPREPTQKVLLFQ